MLLNARAWDLVDAVLDAALHLRISSELLENGAEVIDFGVKSTGSLEAGLRLAEICMSGLATVNLQQDKLGTYSWPKVTVWTDHPLEACLYSQYAGWAVQQDKYFAMCSGPVRASAAFEPLFEKLPYHEKFYCAVGVLETAKLPPEAVVEIMAQKARIEPRNLRLLVARTASQAGNIQIVARSVETCMHKLYELGFDVRNVVSGIGSAPLPPVAKDDLTAIGRTNDAILYGGSVTLMVAGTDEAIQNIGAQVPSSSSAMYGRPFQEIFESVGHDFYKIDPLVFSPAQVIFHNLTTGNVFAYGELNEPVVLKSFGLT
jgi:methenyltetrahydromethanopterin cyclohydrolase